jgi:hypothetical protein
MFHILLYSWYILTESNELSAILDFWGMHDTSQVGSRKFFHLDSQWSIWTRNTILIASSNFELNKNNLNNFWLLLCNLEVIL